MMITSTIYDFFFYNDFDNTFLTRNNYVIWVIILSYVFFVERLGPEIMKNRKPMDLRYIIILFNAMLVSCNLYLCLKVGNLCYIYWNEQCNLKYNPDFKKVQKVFEYIGWQILLLKITELFDTVFFILRKKNNQASFLHVFHHAIVLLLFYIGLKRREIGYYGLIIASMNCGVHVLTYLYYGLSAIGPKVRKYLWWKKYLTMIQIMQFLLMMSYMVYASVTNCEEFNSFDKSSFCTVAVICVLFLNFYFKSYKKEKLHVETTLEGMKKN